MLAQGPNTLNLANYTKQQNWNEQQIVSNEYEQNEQQQQNIQQQFNNYVKDIKKYDEILNKITKNIAQISQQQYFITDFYPQFIINCTYDLDLQQKFIQNFDQEFSLIISNLSQYNTKLKLQIKGWLFQYAKKTRLSEILLKQNQLLRKYVTNKNKDIIKIITSLSNTENQQLNTLDQNLHELKEQNGVLLDHLKEMKNKIKQQENEQKKIMEAHQKILKQKQQLKIKLQIQSDQQQHYSKMLSLCQFTTQETKKRVKQLQLQKQKLLSHKKQYQKDQQLIQKQIINCKIDRQDLQKYLKIKFKDHQTQKQQLINQISSLSDKIQKIQQQSSLQQEQLIRYDHRIQQYTTMCKDLNKKIYQVEEVLKISEEQERKIRESICQNTASIDMINIDVDLLKQQMKQLEIVEELNKERYKKQIKELEIIKKQEILKYNNNYSKNQSKIAKTILQQKLDLVMKKKEIQQYEKKINDKKYEIQGLKKQIIQYKQNQIQLTNLKQKLREGKKNGK